MSTAIVSLSAFKAKAARMLAEMKADDHEIVLTQRGAASAVVQDFETHQRHRNALLLLKLLVQGEADVTAGRVTSQERVFEDVRSRLTTATDG